jgi:hypothetical protein
MREDLKRIAENFIKNRDAVKAAFPWDNSMFYPICSMIFTNEGKTADAETLKACKQLFKKSLNVFSSFRGAAEISFISMLAVDGNPEERLSKAKKLYGMLKELFWGSEFLPVAAMMLSRTVPEDKYEELCVRARRIYELFKKEHPLLTSSEDSVYAVMLALSEKDDARLIAECEE